MTAAEQVSPSTPSEILVSEFAMKSEEELEEAPAMTATAATTATTTAVTRQRLGLPATNLSWLGSMPFLVLLQLASLGLVVAWYVHVPFFVDTDTLTAKYAIRLSNVKLYSDWGIAVFVVIPFVAQFAIAGLCINEIKLSRCLIGFVLLSYILMIAVGHGLGAIETHSREVNEAVFAAEFNRYYCSLRTMRVCLDGNEQRMLTLIFMGGVLEIATEAELDAGTHVVRADLADKVLSEYAGSLATDSWCGEAWIAQTSKLTLMLEGLENSTNVLTPEEWIEGLENALPPEVNLAHPAPYASNTHLFAAFTDEWATRMGRTDLLLGAAVVCLMLAMWCWRLREDNTL